MIVVDSSIWIDYFNGRNTRETAALDGILSEDLVIVGDLIIVEVLQGFRTEAEVARAEGLLETLEFHEMVGKEVALQSARNYRTLRARGVTVRKTIDVIIGTWCILNDRLILHADRDFDSMEIFLGLRVLRR
jgi:hypothetical protein